MLVQVPWGFLCDGEASSSYAKVGAEVSRNGGKMFKASGGTEGE